MLLALVAASTVIYGDRVLASFLRGHDVLPFPWTLIPRTIQRPFFWQSSQWMWMPQEPSDAQLDALILRCAQTEWIKVEAVIVRVGDLCAVERLRFDPDVIGARIIALVQDGSLEGLGNLSRWRDGEVRLR